MIDITLITIPIAIFSFFMGFYLRVVLHTFIDILNVMQRLKFNQETNVQEQLNNQPKPNVSFVEPMTMLELEALQEQERIERLNRGQMQ